MSAKREFEPINIKVYKDEDPDILEFLKGKPKTWIVKEALRFYRDHHAAVTLSQSQQVPTTIASPTVKTISTHDTDASKGMENL